MVPDSEIPIFRVCGACEAFDGRCVRTGWHAAPDGIFVPRTPKPCDVLHLSGTAAADRMQFAETLAILCREVGAQAIFWEPTETELPKCAEIVRLWQIRCSLQVYSPLTGIGAIPVITDPAEPTAAPFAVGITARATLTELRDGGAVRRTDAAAEICRLIESAHPAAAFSAELCADFFSHRDRDRTQFAVFDTEETLQHRIGRALERNPCAVFCGFSKILKK